MGHVIAKETFYCHIVTLMDANASSVIAEHESMVVEYDLFDRFVAACDDAKAPNQAPKEAVKKSKELGI